MVPTGSSRVLEEGKRRVDQESETEDFGCNTVQRLWAWTENYHKREEKTSCFGRRREDLLQK